MSQVLEEAASALQAGNLAEAVALSRAALARDPADPAALRLHGFACLAAGEPAQALALLSPLARLLPRDEQLGIALGEAAWAVEGAAASLPHYRRVLAVAPWRTRLRLRLGLALLTAGQPASAVQHLQAALQSHPDDAVALTHLGMALLAGGQAAPAVPVLRRALALDAREPGPAFHLGQALREGGDLDGAVAALTEAVRRGPEQPHLHLALGDALFARRDDAMALAALRRAVALDPAVALAWAKLGDAEQRAGDLAAAVDSYRRAVALQPNEPEFRALLGNALVAAGDGAAATEQLGRSTLAHLHRPAAARLRIGIVAAPGRANTPTDYIIDRARHDVGAVFMLHGFGYPAAAIAASYDVLFNAVSDADAAPGALALAMRLVPQLGLPVVNHPCAIAGTTRDRMAARLAGIEGLHVPMTRRYERATLAADAFDAFAGLVLVRSAGSHGGNDTTVADSPAAMLAAAAALPPGDVYLTRFADFRSSDGRYRKLRLVFVAGEVFPVHLAIGGHWLSHYFRTDMAGDATLRAEEAAFLRDPAGFLGRVAWDGLAGLPARAGLDFFGVDAAIGGDGRLIVFECNASMLVRHTDRPAMFDYKRQAAERVRDALGRLLSQASGGDVTARALRRTSPGRLTVPAA